MDARLLAMNELTENYRAMFLLLCEAREIAEAAWARVDKAQHIRNKTRRLIAADRRDTKESRP